MCYLKKVEEEEAPPPPSTESTRLISPQRGQPGRSLPGGTALSPGQPDAGSPIATGSRGAGGTAAPRWLAVYRPICVAVILFFLSCVSWSSKKQTLGVRLETQLLFNHALVSTPSCVVRLLFTYLPMYVACSWKIPLEGTPEN